MSISSRKLYNEIQTLKRRIRALKASKATTLNELTDVTYSSGDLTITDLDTVVAGSLTIDSSGDITLDADGGEIFFHDGDAQQGVLKMDTSNKFILSSSISTNDMYLMSGRDIFLDAAGGDVKVTGNVSGSAKGIFTTGLVTAGPLNVTGSATINNGYIATHKSSSLASAGDKFGNILIAGLSTGASVAAGNLVYLNSSKQWNRTAAGDGANAGDIHFIGIATTTTPHTHGVMTQGLYSLNTSYVSGSISAGGIFDVGQQVYIHPHISGSFTTLIPSGSGEIVRVVGHAIDASIIYFNPSPDYIEI